MSGDAKALWRGNACGGSLCRDSVDLTQMYKLAFSNCSNMSPV